MVLKMLTKISTIAFLLVASSMGMEAQELNPQALKRIALVIGNQGYIKPIPKLHSPANDATTIANALRSLGFDVVLKTDQTRDEMVDLVNDFVKRSTDADIAVFYFSGHGFQSPNQDNYLVAVNADNALYTQPDHYAIDVDAPFAVSSISHPRAKIFIFDACRESMPAPFKGLSQGFSPKVPKTSCTLIAYAAAPGSVAFDDPDAGLSLFTAELAKHLGESTNIINIFIETQEAVADKTDNQQMPWLNFSPGLYNFGFQTTPKVEIAARATPPPSDAASAVASVQSQSSNSEHLTTNASSALDDSSVEAFVRKHWTYLEDMKIDKFMADYSKKVEWYNEGQVSSDYIRRQKKSYIQHWDKISYKITSPITVELKDKNNALVNYKMLFKVNNQKSGTKAQGAGTDTLEIRLVDGSPKIVSENQVITD